VVRTVGAAAAATRHGLAIDGALFEYREKGSTNEVAGVETVGARSARRLRVRMQDGFEEDEFIDRETWMLIASRKVAPVHAFGPSVASETRFDDFPPVAGVLFSFASREVEIASGKVLSEGQWTSIVANREIDLGVFSPPALDRTPLQKLLDHLFLERSDRAAVRWSYDGFRRAYPAVDTDAGIQAIGYQILKMGDVESATALLEANARDHPGSSGAAFGLGRALNTAGRSAEARTAFTRALALDPGNKRARTELDALK
jgi:Tetratricopeptide repeat